jgi:hypothetical protein
MNVNANDIVIITKCARAKGLARKWVRSRAIYVARLKPGQSVQDVAQIRQTAEWYRVGVADARYTGARSYYSSLLARAEEIAARWRAESAA